MAEYYGHISIYGNESIASVMQQAKHRLEEFSGSTSPFDLDAIKHVFFGSVEAQTDSKIGCRALLLDDVYLYNDCKSLRCDIFFSTTGGYPDYFSRYLVDTLSSLDPQINIHLSATGDGIYKVSEWFSHPVK
jgi:hypothetical protein